MMLTTSEIIRHAGEILAPGLPHQRGRNGGETARIKAVADRLGRPVGTVKKWRYGSGTTSPRPAEIEILLSIINNREES
jgi:hypothetical protein